MKEHHYQIDLTWTGNEGKGTESYKAYSRNHLISAAGKSITIPGASDPSFLGDPTRYNPEELFVSSLSACHMLWYLHLCAVNKIVVTDYEDHATGTMIETTDGGGRFTEVTLHPKVTITDPTQKEKAHDLHHQANGLCFIANSCNFKVRHEPEILS